MATQKSPLTGYNHNLKYKGRVYHVQTEDSGLDNPHIFTHLFHSGSILQTSKQEYRDLIGNPDWESLLRTRMQAQHKDMMKALVKGDCDDRIVAFFGALVAEVEEEIPMATLPPPPKRERASSGESPAQTAAPRPPAPAPAPSAPQPRPPAPAPQATPWSPPPSQAPPPQRPAAPARSGGVVVAMPMVIVAGPGGAPPRASGPSRPMPPPQTTPPPNVAFRPEESKTIPDSIFGSDLISEKSLDEVILAYLSEDLAEK